MRHLSPSTTFTGTAVPTQDLSTQEAGAGINNYPENVRTARATGDPASKTKRKKAERDKGLVTRHHGLQIHSSPAIGVLALYKLMPFQRNRGAQSGDVDYSPSSQEGRNPNLSSPVTSKTDGAT